MSKPDQILCEVCHERPATHHVCNANTGKSSDLCAECFETSAPPEVLQSSIEVRDAHCQYCGGQPCAGGTDFIALTVGIQQTKFMCFPCTQEYYRYIQQEMSRDHEGLSQQQQLEEIRKVRDRADAHMKQWVSERGSR
jgi:hypothetical protein